LLSIFTKLFRDYDGVDNEGKGEDDTKGEQNIGLSVPRKREFVNFVF
jgi:hypothetical protein